MLDKIIKTILLVQYCKKYQIPEKFLSWTKVPELVNTKLN